MTLGDEGRLTDERLRMWNLSQATRERLCAAVLSLSADYQDVRPRRPEGGPDRGRDLEAVFRGSDRALARLASKTERRTVGATSERYATSSNPI